jgi:hypothetical protein
MVDVFAQPIMEFRQFIDSLQSARADEYLGVPHSRIADEQAFANIQAHLADYYAGVEPVHSFLDANGSVFDCIPVEQQFSLRGQRERLPKAPELPGDADASARSSAEVGMPVVQLHARFTDQVGNQMLAPEGTIPVQRLTLAHLAGFPDLPSFLRKHHPSPAPQVPPPPHSPPQRQLHQYATAQQDVGNVGGRSILNIWDPQVSAPQLMSLSQVWFTIADRSQTVEAGWQVNPARYGNTKPVLFTYWTSDGYHTTGCYNLLCHGFVQVNGAWMLGGAFPFWSSSNGPQCEIPIAYLLDGGRWWLFVGGQPVGYFPTSIFQGGAMAQGSTRIVFGGEATTTNNQSWPPMGSGAFAAAQQWQVVAYQRQIQYFPTAGGRHDADLAAALPAPWCYTAIPTKYNAPWNATLWFGGTPPSGGHCVVA